MAAAAITPSIVSKREITQNAITGTPKKVVEYYLEATKVTQADWILLETAIGTTANTLLGATGITIDASSDMAAETLTYDDSADKLICGSAAVGTVKVFVRMIQG